MIHRLVNIRNTARIAALALLVGACSSTSTSSNSTPVDTEASTSTVESLPDTTPETTTTSSTVPEPVVYTLRANGIGPLDLGTPAVEVVAALTTAFGSPISDETTDYPVDDGFGGYQSVDGEMSFVALVGRSVCWGFGFCAQFGGNVDATTHVFMGWTYGDDSAATLSSTSGVTIGSRWSDFPTMDVDPGGCYTVGTGTIDGIHLTLRSDDVQFGGFDDSGNYVEAVPPADQVSVIHMEIGDIPLFLFGDC